MTASSIYYVSVALLHWEIRYGFFLNSFASAGRPVGKSCHDLPIGYCRQRSSSDKEALVKWNEKQLENKGKGNGPFGNGGGNGNGNGNGHGAGGWHSGLFGNLTSVDMADVAFQPEYTPYAPGEYEPVEGILLAFDGSSSGYSTYDLDVVAQIAAAVTNQVKLTKVFMVSNANQKPVYESEFQTYGVDMSRVVWIEENINSVWIRDYGPRIICDPSKVEVNNPGVNRGAVDTKYYDSRPSDDAAPIGMTDNFNYDYHDLNVVVHSGGNGHYFSTGEAFSTRLLTSDYDNAALSDEELKQYWLNYKGANLNFFDKLDWNVDGTGHIDMWFLPVDDHSVIIGEFEEDGYGSKAVTDSAAEWMAERNYTVYRIPNWNDSGDHFTYTNAVIANDVVVISKFNDPRDDIAVSVFETAFPGKSIVQVDSSGIIGRSGALHCIAQHVYDCSVLPTTMAPTSSPTPAPTAPTSSPTPAPTRSPTPPTPSPTQAPTDSPTAAPTHSPTLKCGVIQVIAVNGNGKCEDGETCLNSVDCQGIVTGKQSDRFCCYGGPSNNVNYGISCSDSQCGDVSSCDVNAIDDIEWCCGDGECTEGGEDFTTCLADCPAPQPTPGPTGSNQPPTPSPTPSPVGGGCPVCSVTGAECCGECKINGPKDSRGCLL